MLSGETRTFEWVYQPHMCPVYAEFSFVIPMTVRDDGSTFAVGVLVERGGAATVAAAMFDDPIDNVPPEDLADACSEVCNIFSDSIARNLYPNETFPSPPMPPTASHAPSGLNATAWTGPDCRSNSQQPTTSMCSKPVAMVIFTKANSTAIASPWWYSPTPTPACRPWLNALRIGANKNLLQRMVAERRAV